MAAATMDKLERLRDILRGFDRVVVAFSGGVDSTFVLKAAIDTLGRERITAITGCSDSLAAQEFDDARELAAQLGATHVIIDTDEFNDPNYLANPANRCYYCKTELYDKLEQFIAARGIGGTIITGVIADDLGDYRPGLEAAKEHHVRHPAAEAGLTKAEIRAISAAWGLPTSDKPASPCLSSRVQYGESITPDKLRQIERAERLLHDLGFRECRVRHHDKLARIEVPAERLAEILAPDLRRRIDAAFREYGYTYVTLDLRGFRSGSGNEVIAFGRVQSTG